MYMTLLMLDLFRDEGVAAHYMIRPAGKGKFLELRTGEYRPMRSGASGLELGVECLYGRDWALEVRDNLEPADHWEQRGGQARFEIRYVGVPVENDGDAGVYNLVLPTGWSFQDLLAQNPGSRFLEDGIYRDEDAQLEALKLTFHGPLPSFVVVATIRHQWTEQSGAVGGYQVKPWRITLPTEDRL
jgi:hypothetical protein